MWPNRALGNTTEYELWRFQKKAISNYPKKKKNVIIGDSKGMAALNPNVLGHNFVNFSIGGATTFEGFVTIKEFLRISEIDTLMICFSPIHYMKDDALSARTIAFGFVSIEDIHNLEKVEREHGITIENTRPGNYLYAGRWFTYYHFPLAFESTFIENIFSNSFNNRPLQSLKDNSGHCLFGLADSSNGLCSEAEILSKTKTFDRNPIIICYLDSIYNLALKNKIKLILVNPPINYSSYEKLKTLNYEGQFDHFMESLKLKYPAMEIHNDYFSLPNSFFGDPDHLNLNGSNFFSNYVRNKLIRSN